MTRTRRPIECPECGHRKPDHASRCRFGAALREGQAQARRRDMSPEMKALWAAVAEQVYRPVVLDGPGIADLVDRITRSVAPFCAALEGPQDGTVDGIRPHRPVTPEQDARMKAAAEQWEAQNPVTPERAATLLAGQRDPDDVPCQETEPHTGHWYAAPRSPINPGLILQTHCPGVANPGTSDRSAWCPQQEPHAAHQRMHADGTRNWCDGNPPETLRKASDQQWPQGSCPGCGQLPVQTRNGRATLHPASCTVTASRVPLLPPA